jgi:hypothetical protein
MRNISDRSLFLEMIKTQPMSIGDIIDHFGVARNTARSWAGHAEVEQVIGSYPRQYKRRDTLAIATETQKQKPKQVVEESDKNIVRLPNVPEDKLEAAFNATMNEGPPKDKYFNFTQAFRSAESLDDLKKLESELIASLVLTRYFQGQMAEYEKQFDS